MSWPALAVGLMMIAAGTALFLQYAWRQVAPYLPTSVATRLANIVAWRVADAETVIIATHIAPGMRVLDVGCGKGRLTIAVARQVFPCGSVVGVDIDKKCVNKLTEKLALPGVANAEAVWSDINHLNLPANAFDRVLLVASLGSIQDKQAALHKLYAAMKPNGVLSITEVALDANRVGFEIVQQLACRAGFLQDFFSKGWLSYTVNFVKRGGAGSASPAVAEKSGYGRAEETVVVPTALGLRVVRDAKPLALEDFDPRPDPVPAERARAESAVIQKADSAKLEEIDGTARPRKIRLIA
jgi:ubiquinone/menaquinone biosynthesis C-methylase UbiE